MKSHLLLLVVSALRAVIVIFASLKVKKKVKNGKQRDRDSGEALINLLKS